MSETGIGRRQLVRTAAVVTAGSALAVGTGVGSASAHEDEHDHSGRGLLGAWRVEHTNDPPADPEPGVTVVAFAAGGAFMATDIMPAGVSGTGAWSADGNRFRVTYWAPLALGPDQPGGSVKLLVRGSLRHGMVSGTFSVTGYGPDGTTVLFTATGTFTGKRIRA